MGILDEILGSVPSEAKGSSMLLAMTNELLVNQSPITKTSKNSADKEEI